MTSSRGQLLARFLTATLTALVLCTTLACNELELQSKARDREIEIDGILTEWKGVTTHAKQERVSFGVLNDGDFLYLAFRSRNDQTNMQLLLQGLILEIKAGEKDTESLRIKYPVGMLSMGRRERDRDPSRPTLGEIDQDYLDSFEILGPGKDESRRFAVNDALGLKLAASTVDGYYSSELKIPLRQSELYPFAVGSEPGQTIEITFNTAKLDQEQMPARGGGRAGGGSGGGRGGGMPGGGRGGTGGSRKGAGPRPGGLPGGEPLRIEVEIVLAP